MSRLIGLAVAVVALVCGAGAAAWAQAYPTRSVRVVVSFPPGGGTDILARIVSQRLSESLGQQFIVDNRPGASGNIAMALVAKAPPDGYTLLATSSAYVVNPSLYAKPGWEPKDFMPVTCLGGAPNSLLVTPSVPAKTVPELVAWLKSNPGKHGFATPGNGTTPHLAGELFRMANGLDIVSVPFGGAAPALQSLMQGQTPLAFMMLSNATEQIRGGNVRALAVTSAKRSSAVPDVPTMTESGVPDQVSETLQFLFAPAATPRDVLEKLYQEIVLIAAKPETQAQFTGMGFAAIMNPPEEAAAQVKLEIAKWAKVVKDANLKVE
jgi:tripartite-type tricarboxylate transporter receptor subunit TctC